MIGLLVHEVGSSYFTQVIRGIDTAVAGIGYDLLLYTSHARVEAEARHALELARRGWEAEAWDVSDEALTRVTASAREEALAVSVRRVDLDAPLPREELGVWDLALVVNFLDRSLFERASQLLRPGGVLLIATFTTDREGEHPSARWCLEPRELSADRPGFETLESREAGGRAGWLGRLHSGSCTI